MIKFGKLNRKKSIVIFDLDHTLIKPKNTRWYRDTWVWLPNMKEKLLQYYKNNAIIIYTNQAGWEKRKAILQKIFLHVLQELPKNILLVIATGYNAYRKPNLLAMQELNLNPSKIHVIGDAAGRKNDHADTDYTLSLNLQKLFPNIKITFATPETELNIFNPAPKVISEIPNIPKFSHREMLNLLVKKFANKKCINICGPTKITDYILQDIQANTNLLVKKSLHADILINPSKEIFNHYKVFIARKNKMQDNFMRFYSYKAWQARKKSVKKSLNIMKINFWINPADMFHWSQYA